MCDEYNFQAQIPIYLGLKFVANKNTIYIWVDICFQIQIQIYLDPIFSPIWIQICSGLLKLSKNEYKYNYLDWLLQIQIQILW